MDHRCHNKLCVNPWHLRSATDKQQEENRRGADLRDRYRDMAKTLGFEGHIEWAEAMT